MTLISGVKEQLRSHLINIPGFRTDRRIIVFESDDWGAVRMASQDKLLELAKSGIKIQNCHYVQNDALASEEDLNQLFDVLSNHKDSQERSPVITANVIMTNPNFEKIKASDFKEYHYEIFTETLEKYPNHKNSFTLWNNGIRERLFYPQFHGREHIQVKRWLNYLKAPESDTRKAFDAGVFGLSKSVTSGMKKSCMASYDWDDMESRRFTLDSISEGLSLFKSLFGYESLSAVAPNYVWHHDVEQVLKRNGIRYIQGSGVQVSPNIGENSFKKIRHYTGQKNKIGQTYLVRNCQFEPSSNPDLDWVDKCISEIKTAFSWKKPAIVEMHRVNFIGYINPENRAKSLVEFNRLLKRIIQEWPEVEFMTSDELGRLIEEYE